MIAVFVSCLRNHSILQGDKFFLLFLLQFQFFGFPIKIMNSSRIDFVQV